MGIVIQPGRLAERVKVVKFVENLKKTKTRRATPANEKELITSVLEADDDGFLSDTLDALSDLGQIAALPSGVLNLEVVDVDGGLAQTVYQVTICGGAAFIIKLERHGDFDRSRLRPENILSQFDSITEAEFDIFDKLGDSIPKSIASVLTFSAVENGKETSFYSQECIPSSFVPVYPHYKSGQGWGFVYALGENIARTSQEQTNLIAQRVIADIVVAHCFGEEFFFPRPSYTSGDIMVQFNEVGNVVDLKWVGCRSALTAMPGGSAGLLTDLVNLILPAQGVATNGPQRPYAWHMGLREAFVGGMFAGFRQVGIDSNPQIEQTLEQVFDQKP